MVGRLHCQGSRCRNRASQCQNEQQSAAQKPANIYGAAVCCSRSCKLLDSSAPVRRPFRALVVRWCFRRLLVAREVACWEQDIRCRECESAIAECVAIGNLMHAVRNKGLVKAHRSLLKQRTKISQQLCTL